MAKDYMAIAKQRIRKPNSKRKPRLLVYSRNKKGKTRLASTAPNGLIIDPEQGTDFEEKLNPDVWPVSDWQEVDDVWNYCKLHGSAKYQWITLDGLPKIYNSALRYVMNVQEEKDLTRKPGFVQQSDWGKANELVKGLLWNFHTLRDVGLIITSQERIIEVTEQMDADEESEQTSHMYVADVPNGCRSTVNSIVDVIGRMYVVRGNFSKQFKTPEGRVITKTTTKQHRLWIGPHELYDTGYRSKFTLPDYIEDPKVSTIIQALREGKQDARQ